MTWMPLSTRLYAHGGERAGSLPAGGLARPTTMSPSAPWRWRSDAGSFGCRRCWRCSRSTTPRSTPPRHCGSRRRPREHSSCTRKAPGTPCWHATGFSCFLECRRFFVGSWKRCCRPFPCGSSFSGPSTSGVAKRKSQPPWTGCYPQYGPGADHRVRVTVEGPEQGSVDATVARLERELPAGAVLRID